MRARVFRWETINRSGRVDENVGASEEYGRLTCVLNWPIRTVSLSEAAFEISGNAVPTTLDQFFAQYPQDFVRLF